MHDFITCSRTDCDFYLDGRCSYGGTAIAISKDGCETFEPAGQWDEEN